jgi:exonuclease SbcC
MNRDSGSCYAKLTFAKGNNVYVSLFSQHRGRYASSGRLQAPKRELSLLTGKILYDRVSGYNDQISRLIGMDFDQFTRSMLLSQGEFSKFLLCDEKDRATILEQITGTDIYSKIGSQIYALYKDEEAKLDKLREGLGQIILLDDQQLAALQSKKSQAADRLLQLSAEEKGLQQILAWYASMQKQAEKEKDLEELALQIDTGKDNYGKQKERLGWHQEAVGCLPSYTLLDLCNTQLQELSAKRETAEKKLEALTSDLAHYETESSQATSAFSKEKESNEKLNELTAKIRPIDSKITSLTDSSTMLTGLVEKETDEAESQREQVEKLKERIAEQTKKVEFAKHYLKEHEADVLLVEELSLYLDARTRRDEFLKNLAVTKKQIQNAAQEQVEISKELTEKSDSKETLALESAAATSELDEATHRLATFPDAETLEQQRQEVGRLQKLVEDASAFSSQMESLEEKITSLTVQEEQEENEQQHCSRLYEKQKELVAGYKENLGMAEKLAGLSGYVSLLQEGHPCPLCGSVSHPKPVASPAEDLMAIRKKVSVAETQLEKLQESLHEAKGKLSLTQALLSADKKTRTALSDSINHEFGIVPARLPEKQEVLEKEYGSLALKVKRLNKDKEAANQAISKLTKAQQTAQKALADSQKETDKLRQQLESLGKDEERSRKDADAIESKLKRTEDALLPFATYDKLDAASLKGLRAAFQEQTATLAKIDLAELEDRLQHATLNLTAQLTRLGSDRNQLAALQQKLAGLRTERTELFGNRNCEAEQKAAEERLEKRRTEEREVQARLATCKEEIASQTALLASLATSRDEQLDLQSTYRKNLEEKLSAHGFSDIATMLAAKLDESQLSAITEETKSFETQQQEYQTRKQLHLQALDELEQTRPKQEEESVRDRSETIAQEITALTEQQGAIGAQLETDRQNRQRYRTKFTQVTDQEQITEKWKQFNSLLGSSDGTKFRKLAQGITLSALLKSANTKLELLNDRYQLADDTESDSLDISVVDSYMGGIVRPASNLSGGETFLVSLALALALSQMMSKEDGIDTLFLDEGFGTLDDELLDTAMNALGNFAQGGKLIGIISHVDKLREVINIQLLLRRKGEGSSRIEGPGVSYL